MITITSIKNKLEEYTNHSNPFVGVDKLGKDWFVKPYSIESGEGERALFNELVAFNLAEKIGLPWPKGHVVQLSEDVKNELNISFSYVIAYEFMHDIQELPDGYQFNDKQVDSLYGKSIFDNWLKISDVKDDTCKLLNGELLFMDAGVAFLDDSGAVWGEDGLIWTNAGLFVESSPYHRGNLNSAEGYNSWMDRICEVSVDFYQSIVDSIPEDWHVPESYKSKFVEVFSSSSDRFIPMMKLCIEHELNHP
ncbi:TPA: HipA family kinase [Serratia marcescens]